MQVMSWAQFISALVALGTPLVVRYLTKASWAGKFRAYALLLVSALNGLLTEVFADHPNGFDLRSAIFSAVIAFIVSVGAYLGLWKQQEGLMQSLDNKGVKD